jgi:hypothetical protein
VVTEGRLILEFTFDDLMRIRSWHFATRQHRELIPRSVIAMQVHIMNIFDELRFNLKWCLLSYSKIPRWLSSFPKTLQGKASPTTLSTSSG